MKKETITRIKMTASEGMVLTDGESYGTEVFLAVDADAGIWKEIPEAEYREIVEAESQQGAPDHADSI